MSYGAFRKNDKGRAHVSFFNTPDWFVNPKHKSLETKFSKA